MNELEEANLIYEALLYAAPLGARYPEARERHFNATQAAFARVNRLKPAQEKEEMQ